jgi:hypothetical protein
MKIRVHKVSHNGPGCWAASNETRTEYFANWNIAVLCATGEVAAPFAHCLDYWIASGWEKKAA